MAQGRLPREQGRAADWAGLDIRFNHVHVHVAAVPAHVQLGDVAGDDAALTRRPLIR